MYINGSVNFSSDTSLVRIVLLDNNLSEYLIFEAYPMIDTLTSFSFTEEGEESFYLNSVIPNSIKIEIIDASINIDNIIISNISIANINTLSNQYQQQKVLSKISKINKKIEETGMLWVAGETSVSSLSYSEKKRLFGEKFNLQGFEYYQGGIFMFMSDFNTIISTNPKSNLIEFFDWRNRHGANNPISPYYDGDLNGSGWITSIKNQGSLGSCAIFAAVGVTEAMTNIYFNQHIDNDLSEQELVSCCSGCMGTPWGSLNYIKTDGVIHENCLPYTASTSTPCNPTCSDEHTQISGILSFPQDSEDNLKIRLIEKGPISGTICPSQGCHAMTLVGFGIVNEGDCIGIGDWGCITIPAGHYSIGQTYWIFKNSWGPTWGDNGYVNIFISYTNITAYNAITPIINALHNRTCVDLDGDGYYNWGIGEKPDCCHPSSPNEIDCDDSDFFLGPYDGNYNCIVIECNPFDDLFMKDTPSDNGIEPNTTSWPIWISEDIWVRNQQDGIQEHENPVYSPTQPVYVYVKIRNRGCSSSLGTEELNLRWAKASTALSWPENWDGSTDLVDGDLSTQPNAIAGNLIATQPIGIIQPGETTILEFAWNPPNPDDYYVINPEPGHFCLLARIVAANDPMAVTETASLGANVVNNNNIVWKNLTIVQGGKNISTAISNVKNIETCYNLAFKVPIEEANNSIINNAKITIDLGEALYQKWVNGGQLATGIEIDTTQRYSLKIISPLAKIKNLIFQPGEMQFFNLRVNYSALHNDEQKSDFMLDAVQEYCIDSSVTGGVRFAFHKPVCPIPYAGIDTIICASGNVTLTASPIISGAIYKWFNKQTNQLLDTGVTITVSPAITTTYILEMTSPEGCIDYDEINIIDYGYTAQTSAVWQPGYANNPFYSATGTCYITGELNIPSGITITIKNMSLKFVPDAKIIVEPGGLLTLDGTVISGVCVDYWDGILEVMPGGTLQLKTGAIIKMGGSGKILVDADTGNQGLLIYENGSCINLKDDATMLEIAGNLEITPNTAFTFTGSGFVKFSSPLYPSPNIIAGSNSSIILNGSDNSDKVLEITQESFYIPANLASFTMNNAKIEMGTNTKMQMNGYNTVFSLTNSKMTSNIGSINNHRGLTLYGQPYVTIDHCIFEYGKYGIFAFLT
ncbi:MAG: hypothetical protein HY738_15245, partial [Bacteroidia bacterium]|nr:hypothetical protein [Bacteroidia bacterium]